MDCIYFNYYNFPPNSCRNVYLEKPYLHAKIERLVPCLFTISSIILIEIFFLLHCLVPMLISFHNAVLIALKPKDAQTMKL